MEPVIKGSFTLEKMPGKGGWTFITLPPASLAKTPGTSWVLVNGTIDHLPLKEFKIWSMKQGGYFMPVKSDIRKAIGKEAGDRVTIALHAKTEPAFSESDFYDCLEDEPRAMRAFSVLDPVVQETILNRIRSASTDSDRVKRIAAVIDALLKHPSKAALV